MSVFAFRRKPETLGWLCMQLNCSVFGILQTLSLRFRTEGNGEFQELPGLSCQAAGCAPGWSTQRRPSQPVLSVTEGPAAQNVLTRQY